MAKTRGTGLLMVWADIDAEFANATVSESAEWARARDSYPWSDRIRPFMRHDVGSPGVYRRVYPK